MLIKGDPVGRFSIEMPFDRIRIFSIKIRGSHGPLIFTMGISISEKKVFILKRDPGKKTFQYIMKWNKEKKLTLSIRRGLSLSIQRSVALIPSSLASLSFSCLISLGSIFSLLSNSRCLGSVSVRANAPSSSALGAGFTASVRASPCLLLVQWINRPNTLAMGNCTAAQQRHASTERYGVQLAPTTNLQQEYDTARGHYNHYCLFFLFVYFLSTASLCT